MGRYVSITSAGLMHAMKWGGGVPILDLKSIGPLAEAKAPGQWAGTG